MILDYPGGPNVITGFLINASGRQKRENQRNGSVKRYSGLLLALRVEE